MHNSAQNSRLPQHHLGGSEEGSNEQPQKEDIRLPTKWEEKEK